MTEHDALATHLEFELGIKEEELANPWHAAFSSAVSFTAGALLPLISILVPPAGVRVPITFVVVLLTLALTGAISADIGGSSKRQAATRLVIGGALALAATFLIGTLLGTTVA